MTILHTQTTRLKSKSNVRDCIVSAAYGVGSEYVRSFLRTFRKVNPSARVILLVWDRGPLGGIANEYHVELHQDQWFCGHVPRIKLQYQQFSGEIAQKQVRVTEILGRSTALAPRLARVVPEALSRSMMSVSLARFFHIRDVLSRDEYGHVLLSDSRDVFFQADPFASPVEMELAQETSRYGADRFNDAWIGEGFGTEILKALEGHHPFCAGTIFGSYKSILDHVSMICHHAKRLRTWKYGVTVHGLGLPIASDVAILGHGTDASAPRRVMENSLARIAGGDPPVGATLRATDRWFGATGPRPDATGQGAEIPRRPELHQ